MPEIIKYRFQNYEAQAKPYTIPFCTTDSLQWFMITLGVSLICASLESTAIIFNLKPYMALYYGASMYTNSLYSLQLASLISKFIPAIWFANSTAGKKTAPYFFVFFFLVTLYPGIIFISSYFYLIGSWMIISIIIGVVATVVSVYPYVAVRTLVRLKDRNLTLGIVMGIVEGLNSLMTGIFMKAINPQSKIVASYTPSRDIDESNYIGSAELSNVPSVIRWLALYILVTMVLGIVLVKLNVTKEDLVDPLWNKWLKLKVTNQTGKFRKIFLTFSF